MFDAKLLHILQHTIGSDQFGQHTGSRNSFVTGVDSKDWDQCQELVRMGLMQDFGPQSIAAGMHYFRATPKGIDAVNLESPALPKVSRSRRRYLEYLDAESSLSFGEWLKWKSRNRRENQFAYNAD